MSNTISDVCYIAKFTAIDEDTDLHRIITILADEEFYPFKSLADVKKFVTEKVEPEYNILGQVKYFQRTTITKDVPAI